MVGITRSKVIEYSKQHRLKILLLERGSQLLANTHWNYSLNTYKSLQANWSPQSLVQRKQKGTDGHLAQPQEIPGSMKIHRIPQVGFDSSKLHSDDSWWMTANIILIILSWMIENTWKYMMSASDKNQRTLTDCNTFRKNVILGERFNFSKKAIPNQRIWRHPSGRHVPRTSRLEVVQHFWVSSSRFLWITRSAWRCTRF